MGGWGCKEVGVMSVKKGVRGGGLGGGVDIVVVLCEGGMGGDALWELSLGGGLCNGGGHERDDVGER